jgi:hypothetical protein
MKAMNCLLVSLVAGTCASAALAGGQDDVTKWLPHKQVTKAVMRGQLNGGTGFNTRASTQVDFYSCNDTGTSSYIFYGGGVHNSGEHLFMEKGGTNSLGSPIGPVASVSKVGTVEFWVVASDASSVAGSLVDCTITLEMFDHCVDWSPVGTTSAPNTCMPSGDDSINQISLGGFYVDLNGSFAPYNGYANGYILDTCSAGLAWNVTDGNGFIDMRCWDYNGGSVPTIGSTTVYNTFDGEGAGICSYPAGGYPALGYSVDNFYFDANNNGRYQRSERYFYGGLPAIANLMIRLGGDDGCSFDLDGDGFVGGGDIDYALELIDAGCPC